MQNFQCPYCLTDSYSLTNTHNKGKFTSWKAVRFHTNKCKANNKEYIICPNIGPIKLQEINKLDTIEQFKKLYPNCKFSSTYWAELRKQGKTHLGRKFWDKNSCIQSLQEFYKVFNKTPSSNDLQFNDNKYPSSSTIERLFGSLNKGMKEAGLVPNEKLFGTPTQALDNVQYRSQSEAYFVDNYLYGKYPYEYEKPYGNGWFTDFYLPELDLYIEIDGELRPQRIDEKINYAKSKQLKLMVISIHEIRNKSFSFDERIRQIQS